jgi:hypothetical protein
VLEPISFFIFSIATAFFCWKKPEKFQYKVLAGYYFVAMVLAIKAILINTEVSNIGLYDLLFLLTSICMGTYFYSILILPWKRFVAIGICFVEAIYFILNNILLSGSTLFDSAGYVILSIGIVIMIFMFMHQILTNVTDESLLLNFDFWFVSAQLVYRLGAFIIFLTFNYLTRKILPAENYSSENRAILTKLWGVHNVLLFLSSLLTLGSVAWISFRKKSQ